VAEAPEVVAMFRPVYAGPIIAAGGFTPENAAVEVARDGGADAIAFGRHYISTPDLVERIRLGRALNPYNRATFYGGGEVGYTDYPALEAVSA
jgi:N-ethylmaleimide reductase